MLITLSNFIQQGTSNGALLLLSALSGPAAVPVFTTVRTMANLWNNVTSILTNPLLPELTRYHSTGDGQKMVLVNEVYWVLVGTIVNFGVLISYPLIATLYGYWTSHMVVLDKPLLCLFIGCVVLINAGGLISGYLNIMNRLRITFAVSIIRAIFGLGIGYLFYLFLGLAGFALGIFGGEVVVLLLVGRHFVKHELLLLEVRMSLGAFAPVTVSTFSVLMYFLAEGFGYSLARYLYWFSIIGVLSAALWGWGRLDESVRARLVDMIFSKFTKKGVK